MVRSTLCDIFVIFIEETWLCGVAGDTFIDIIKSWKE